MVAFFTQKKRGSDKPVRTKVSKLMLCKCGTTQKDFCIRLDRNIDENGWHMAFAFPFHPSMKGEDFASSQKETITILDRTKEFKGCPCCSNTVMNFCSCGGIFCASGDGTGLRTCPVCGKSDQYGYHGNEFSVKSSSY